MSECKKCGIDGEELLRKLRANVANLDLLLWRMELANHE